IATVERAGAHHGKTRAPRVGVVDARETRRATPLLRGAGVAAVARRALVEIWRAGNGQRVLGHDELQAEGAAGPGLAIQAVAGIDVGELVELHGVAHRAAAA